MLPKRSDGLVVEWAGRTRCQPFGDELAQALLGLVLLVASDEVSQVLAAVINGCQRWRDHSLPRCSGFGPGPRPPEDGQEAQESVGVVPARRSSSQVVTCSEVRGMMSPWLAPSTTSSSVTWPVVQSRS